MSLHTSNAIDAAIEALRQIILSAATEPDHIRDVEIMIYKLKLMQRNYQ